MTNLKIAVPVTSGLTGNGLLFGALTNADANASLFTVNALADFVSTISLNLGNATVNATVNSTFIKILNASANVVVTPSFITLGSNVAIDLNNILVGNSTVNLAANSTAAKYQNSTVQSTYGIGSINTGNSTVNGVTNTISSKFQNSTVQGTFGIGSVGLGSNVNLDTVKITIGNTIANSTSNSIIYNVANASGQSNITPHNITSGNSTVFATIGLGGITLTGSNTFTLGSGSLSAAANGYTFLPGGIIIQWGWTSANSSSGGNITFPVAFPTNIFQKVAVASNTANAAAVSCIIIASNTTTMNVRTSSAAAQNTTAGNVSWFAIGN